MGPDVADYYATREPRYCRTEDMNDACTAAERIIEIVERQNRRLGGQPTLLEAIELFTQGRDKLREFLSRQPSP